MKYLLQRLGFYLLAFLAAITINFFLPRMMPGDPVQSYLASLYTSGGTISQETVRAIEKLFGFIENEPLWKGYLRYMGSIFSGNWGISLKFYPQPVTEVLARGLRWTFFLVGSSIIVSYTITTLLGIWAAWRRGSTFDSIVTISGRVLSNVPAIVITLGVYFVFASRLGWFPTGYAYDNLIVPGFTLEFIISVLYHAVLPVLSIVILGLGGIMGMRANMINQLGSDYIIMGWAKGVPDRTVMFSYGARNAMIPTVTALAMSLGFVFGGSIITEIVFNYPGIGLIMFQGISARDYPLIQGQLLITTLMVLSANFVSDFLIFAIDPRIRRQ